MFLFKSLYNQTYNYLYKLQFLISIMYEQFDPRPVKLPMCITRKSQIIAYLICKRHDELLLYILWIIHQLLYVKYQFTRPDAESPVHHQLWSWICWGINGSLTFYHSDDIMDAMASQITSLMILTQPFIQAQIKENIKAPPRWPLCGEFTGDRWNPCTNGQ